MAFQKAARTQAKLRMALIGPAGSGKTYTALKLATALGWRIAVIDTERGSASHYADEFEFDTDRLQSFHPQTYIDAIHEAEKAGYDVVIVDSLSHAWMGKDGALELVDKAAKRSQSGNSFVAWREVTPLHNALVDAMVGCRIHIIVTMRTKTEYVQEKDDRGKTIIRKVGLQPVQRDGLEYEFDVIADMSIEENGFIVSKTRCKALTGYVGTKPGQKEAEILHTWLTTGAERLEPPPTAEHKPTEPSGNGHKATAPMITAEQIKAIHASAKTVGLDEPSYRAELQRRYGVTSSKELTAAQAQELGNAWRARPTPPAPAKTIEEPADEHVAKLRSRLRDRAMEIDGPDVEFADESEQKKFEQFLIEVAKGGKAPMTDIQWTLFRLRPGELLSKGQIAAFDEWHIDAKYAAQMAYVCKHLDKLGYGLPVEAD